MEIVESITALALIVLTCYAAYYYTVKEQYNGKRKSRNK